jgi:D-alanyl-D-alanine carboxypeptidase
VTGVSDVRGRASVTDHTGRRLLARVAHAQASGRVPSVVAGVVRDGAAAWFGTYGGPAVEGHDPFDVQYRIGSITKTMTAVLVLQDVRAGRVALEDPVSAVLGDLGGHPFAHPRRDRLAVDDASAHPALFLSGA